MHDTDTQPAPEFQWPPEGSSKWLSERDAFRKIKPTLLPGYEGQYVAVHEEQVVESGSNQVDVALRAYERFGYVPIFVGFVSSKATPLIQMPSPRLRPESANQ